MKRSEVAKKRQKLKRGMKALREDERREREFARGVPVHDCLWPKCLRPAPAGSPWCYRHHKVARDLDVEELMQLPGEQLMARLAEHAEKMRLA